MALDISVPAAGQTLASSRDPIRNNFVSVNDQFALDHYAFNSTNNGLHKKVTLPDQAAPPVAVATSGIVYGAQNATSLTSELHFIRATGNTYPAAVQNIDFTFANMIANGGSTRLPSGILLSWGAQTITAGNATATITPPGYAQILNVQLTPRDASATFQSVIVQTIFATQFDIRRNSTSGTYTVQWFTIGY